MTGTAMFTLDIVLQPFEWKTSPDLRLRRGLRPYESAPVYFICIASFYVCINVKDLGRCYKYTIFK